MAKSNVQKKIEKYQNMSSTKLIIILVILLVAAFIYVYTSGQEEPYQYSSEQDAETGYYYYHYDASGDYYYEANDMIGEQLMSQLNVIINRGFQSVDYGEIRYLLQTADLSLEDPTKVWTIYDGELVDPTWDGGSYESWNREHIWPNSRMGEEDNVVNSDEGIASDAHNLRAAKPRTNSTRNNRFYSDGSGEAAIMSDGGYYPGDDHRGDVARILFYMATMYDYLVLTDDMDLIPVDATYDDGLTAMGKLSVLLEWHRLDPVSDFEKERNDVIFEAQANRNPFIDHPEYAHLIWENMTIDDITTPANNDTTAALSGIWKESYILWMSIN